jgi:hypothetical protein
MPCAPTKMEATGIQYNTIQTEYFINRNETFYQTYRSSSTIIPPNVD